MTTIETRNECGFSMLIAEDEEGTYEPVAIASTVREAKELAEGDLRGRHKKLEADDDPGICPYVYKLWLKTGDGENVVIASWFAATLLA